MDDVTAYFISTDRINAPASLESLTKQGLTQALVIVRNVVPLHAAYSKALSCRTPYALLLDDDVILYPGVVDRLLTEFKKRRTENPGVFWIHPIITDEISGELAGGLKLFYVPLLKKIGFPNTTHVSWAQRLTAARMGYSYVKSDLKVGLHTAGTLLDVYKRYLWLQIRHNAGERRPVDFAGLLKKAEETGNPVFWAACLGIVDGWQMEAGHGSKDESVMGRAGEKLNFETPRSDEIRALVYDRLRTYSPDDARPPGE